MRKTAVLFFALATSLAALAAGPGKAANAAGPNVVLITLDTLRADRAEAYGDRKGTMPNLNSFAKEAAVFTNSMTPSPITLPAHATIMTGCFPGRTGLFDNGIGSLSPKTRTLAELLREKGYETRAFVAASVLDAKYGLSRGFDVYDDDTGVTQRRFASEITGRAVAYLKDKRPKPFFLWVHYFDAHQPYLTPDDAQGEVTGDYDRAVKYLDAQLGPVFSAIPPGTLVIVASDHGEGLGDHGELTHGLLLYQPTMAVMIMARGPGFAPSLNGGFRTLADIAPAVCRAAGIKAGGFDGAPLDEEGARVLPLSTLLPLNEYRWKPLFGAADGRFKWIKGDKLKLFDLSADPKETADMALIAPKEAAELRRAIPAYEDIRGSIEMAGFAGLGYLTGTPSKEAQVEKFPDPRSMLKVFEGISGIRELRERNDHAGAAAKLRELVKQDPGNPALLFALGDSLRHTGELDEAVKWLDESLKASPALVPSLVSKGLALMGKGSKEEAAGCFEKAIGYDPDSIEALNPLIAYNLDLNKPAVALPLLESAIQRGIATADTYLMQGRVHLIQNKADMAEKDFDNALRVTLTPGETLKQIGDIYLMRGYLEKAKAIFLEGTRRFPRYPDNYLTLGAFYLSLEKPEAALDAFQKALNCDLKPEDRKNVTEIVEELKKGAGQQGE